MTNLTGFFGRFSKEQIVNHYMMESAYAWRPQFNKFSVWTLLALVCVYAVVSQALLRATISQVTCRTDYTEDDDLQNLMITKDMCVGDIPADQVDGPIYVYYEIENFYQNDAQWLSSRCDDQFKGQIVLNKDRIKEECGTKYGFSSDGRIYFPCGAGPREFFTDAFTITDQIGTAELDDSPTAIAWKTDPLYIFKEPSQAEKAAHASDVYFWLDEYFDNSLYEYEKSGPGITNAHFMVWMHTAATSTFRKFFGIIRRPLTFPFWITARGDYPVRRFNGKKKVILERPTAAGSNMFFLGVSYAVVSGFLLIVAILNFIQARKEKGVEK